MTTSTKKYISLLIKMVIVLSSFWFVYHKISTNEHLYQFFNDIKSRSLIAVLAHLILVFSLMFANWFIEAKKWIYLTRYIEKISFYKSVSAVFCGLCLAIFTPNRIGEYGGRIFYLSPRKRILGLMAMAVGNISQMVLTNVFGILAVLFFLSRFSQLSWLALVGFILLGLTIIVLLFIFFFNIRWIEKVLIWIPYLKRNRQIFRVLSSYKKRELFNVLLFSLLRFIIFTSQYYIIFHWLMPTLHSYDIVLMTLLLLFVQSALPSLDLFDIGVRSFTALYFFEYVTQDELSVLAGTAGIWLINIIIPALIGSFFVFKLNIFGKAQFTNS